MIEVAAIVLAAGRASRFTAGDGAESATSKVFAPIAGRALIAHVVAAVAASRASPVIVVTGRDSEFAAGSLRGMDVVLVHNPRYAEGMAGSITVALAALPPQAEAAIVLLADMPRVTSRTIDALIETFERESSDAVVPCYQGRRGNPVLISRALIPAMLRLRGDEGARRLLYDGATRVASCVVDDPGILVDVDTREALDACAALYGAGSRQEK